MLGAILVLYENLDLIAIITRLQLPGYIEPIIKMILANATNYLINEDRLYTCVPCWAPFWS